MCLLGCYVHMPAEDRATKAPADAPLAACTMNASGFADPTFQW
jgi:hypothetical protein